MLETTGSDHQRLPIKDSHREIVTIPLKMMELFFGLILICGQRILVDFSPSLFQVQLTSPVMLMAIIHPRMAF